MHRSRTVLLTRLATAATGAALLLAGCDGDADGAERYPHETGARCATEADSPADCEAAEDLAEAVEALAGVEAVEYEFRTIDGEGINELILSVVATSGSAAEEVAAAITAGRAGLPSVDADRDTSLTVSRAGAGLHIDDDDAADATAAAELVVAAGGLAEHGVVQTSLAPAEIWIDLPAEASEAAIGAAAEDVAAAAVDRSVHVVISGSGSYLSGRGLDTADVRRWDAIVAALGPGDPTVAVDGRDVTVTIDGPVDIRPRDFTFETYGDRWWPMVRAHLDAVRDLGSGATYRIDTNWEQTEDGFDTLLSAVAGPADEGPDPRGWNAPAESYLDR